LPANYLLLDRRRAQSEICTPKLDDGGTPAKIDDYTTPEGALYFATFQLPEN